MAHFICSTSGEHYPLTADRWRSDRGSILDLEVSGMFDPEALIERPPTLWRYFESFPIGPPFLSLGELITPLVSISLAGTEVAVKVDYLFPSGSYKDRGAALLMSFAAQMGVSSVVQDSSGNAGSAIAAYAAHADIACTLFVPASTSEGKLVQMRMYGADIQLIPGPREASARAAMEAASSQFYASHVWNPVFLHGTKTFAFELCEQMGWQAPDSLVLPAGNGTLLLGAYIGFREMKEAGIIDQIPALIAVQAANCAPLAAAFEGRDFGGATPTYGEGIAISDPPRGAQILEAVRDSGGRFITVEEAEIRQMTGTLASRGWMVEPTSGAVIAGAEIYARDHAQKGERIASSLTGIGLKATDKLRDWT